MINAKEAVEISTNAAIKMHKEDMLSKIAIRESDDFKKLLNFVEDRIKSAAKDASRGVCIPMFQLAYHISRTTTLMTRWDESIISLPMEISSSLKDVLRENNYSVNEQFNDIFNERELLIEW